MLLGYAHVEEPVRVGLGELGQPGAVRHRGGDGDDTLVLGRKLEERLGKRLGVSDVTVRPLDIALGYVETGDAVEDPGVVLGKLVALALLGEHVHQQRAFDLLAVFQDLD